MFRIPRTNLVDWSAWPINILISLATDAALASDQIIRGIRHATFFFLFFFFPLLGVDNSKWIARFFISDERSESIET